MLILSLVGFYNGYPLVYSDTRTYIYSGFESFIPKDRPIFYGLFLKLFSFKTSFWFVILVQNYLTAFIIYITLKSIEIIDGKLNTIYYSIVLFLTVFTGIAWYSNQLMPDFLTPILFLALYNFIFNGTLSLLSKTILAALILFAIACHFSHLLISLVFLLVLFFVLKILKEKRELYFKKFALAFTISISSFLLIPTLNFFIEKTFILGKGTHVFFMAHLSDTGILKVFLDDKCAEKEFSDCKLCNEKDSLPQTLDDFLWAKNTLEKTGGWHNSRNEYTKIIKANFTTSKYLLSNIAQSAIYGCIQLTNFKVGNGLVQLNYTGSPHYEQIKWHMKNEVNNYLKSRQNVEITLGNTFDLINNCQALILLICAFLLILSIKFKRELECKSLQLVIVCTIGIIVNAFFTAGLNAPSDRFQAKVIWLLPFAIILAIVKNYTFIQNKLKSLKN